MACTFTSFSLARSFFQTSNMIIFFFYYIRPPNGFCQELRVRGNEGERERERESLILNGPALLCSALLLSILAKVLSVSSICRLLPPPMCSWTQCSFCLESSFLLTLVWVSLPQRSHSWKPPGSCHIPQDGTPSSTMDNIYLNTHVVYTLWAS